MAVVITVAQQKGGAGKTTIAASLAAAIAQGTAEIPGRSVGLIDIDPQRSLTRWHALRLARPVPAATIDLAEISGWRLPSTLDRMRAGHDVILIDSPPNLDTDARRAIRAADIVLVPVQPSPPDLWAAAGTMALAAEEKRPARIVLNRAPAGGRMREHVERDIASLGYAVGTMALGNRTGFATAFAEGLGITEAAPRSVGAAELRALLAEIEEALK